MSPIRRDHGGSGSDGRPDVVGQLDPSLDLDHLYGVMSVEISRAERP
jgi:hypothetical protein